MNEPRSAGVASFQVRLEPQGAIFDCPADQPLLLAALAAGIALPLVVVLLIVLCALVAHIVAALTA